MSLSIEVVLGIRPKPFVKWAGGKGQLIEKLRSFYPRDFGTYFEPFLGGGAVFFDLAGRHNSFNSVLSDTNGELITTYEVIRDSVEGLIETLKEYKKKYEEKRGKYFYEVRSSEPCSKVEKAARLIFLNKTCFNGLYRVNSKGKFNVPFGSHKNPKIFDDENLLAVCKALRRSKAKLFHTSFDCATKDAEKGDFVYFDPPYHPLSKTASFTSYTEDGFTIKQQKLLAILFKKLHRKGCFILLSNSNTNEVLSLYRDKDFFIEKVPCLRTINCKGALRTGFSELIISNYKVG